MAVMLMSNCQFAACRAKSNGFGTLLYLGSTAARTDQKRQAKMVLLPI